MGAPASTPAKDRGATSVVWWWRNHRQDTGTDGVTEGAAHNARSRFQPTATGQLDRGRVEVALVANGGYQLALRRVVLRAMREDVVAKQETERRERRWRAEGGVHGGEAEWETACVTRRHRHQACRKVREASG